MSSLLRLFVYGTLKRGGSNHRRFCEGAVSVVPAWTWGRLHILANRYPILVVPSSRVLRRGTARYADDVECLAPPPSWVDEAVGWRRVQGEIVSFVGSEGALRLPRFDALEDYEPVGASPVDDGPASGLREARLGYERVLIAVRAAPAGGAGTAFETPGSAVLTWTYVCPPALEAQCPVFEDDAWDEESWRRQR